MPWVYDWELYYEVLSEMYLLHNMHLKDIMTEMLTRHSFSPRKIYLFFILTQLMILLSKLTLL